MHTGETSWWSAGPELSTTYRTNTVIPALSSMKTSDSEGLGGSDCCSEGTHREMVMVDSLKGLEPGST